jgi:hypothetical protein
MNLTVAINVIGTTNPGIPLYQRVFAHATEVRPAWSIANRWKRPPRRAETKFVPDKRILRIIGMTLRSGVMIDGLRTPTTEGTVQGSPLSPLLSNVVLDELDKELEHRGLAFCRYADGRKKRHLFNKLVKCGVSRTQAARTVFSNRGRWALSHTQAIEKAYSNQWLIKMMGQKIRSKEAQPHWFSVNRWIKVA